MEYEYVACKSSAYWFYYKNKELQLFWTKLYLRYASRNSCELATRTHTQTQTYKFAQQLFQSNTSPRVTNEVKQGWKYQTGWIFPGTGLRSWQVNCRRMVSFLLVNHKVTKRLVKENSKLEQPLFQLLVKSILLTDIFKKILRFVISVLSGKRKRPLRTCVGINNSSESYTVRNKIQFWGS